jgi:hypothetical protein
VLIAAVLYRRWVRAGRPRGIEEIEREAEAEDEESISPEGAGTSNPTP